MIDYRLATLLVSDVLFAALSLLFLFRPAWGPALFPAYGALFVWSDFRREKESHVIFLFLVSTAGLVLAVTAPPALKLPYLLELGGLWLLAWALSRRRARTAEETRVLQGVKAGLESAALDDEREVRHHDSYQESVSGQIRLRRDLTEGARSLGNTMDAREVHVRLADIVGARFPGSRVMVVAATEDPLVDLAARARGPVLVKDARDDARLPPGTNRGFVSGMAIPLKVMRQEAGYLRVESDAAGTFGPEDVRTLDLLATMAALSLENIHFFETVRDQATHDPLTQLFSHKAFQTRLHEEVLRAGRSQTPLSMILCDVDHFKSYNDRFGHQAGDQLLRTFAAILSSFARPVDFPARYGGEEFCLILPNFVRSEAVDLADRIRRRVESEAFVFQGKRTGATMSLGVSSFPVDATTASQIVRVADERLYRAKHQGRNQVVG